MLFGFYKQNINVIMSQPSACSFYLQDDFEEVPDQYDAGKQTPLAYYNSSKLQSHLTINKNIEKDIKKSQVANFINKTQQYLQNKSQKITLLKSQQNNRLMNVCTFKPSINKSRSKSARNIKQFLDSQQRHLEKIEEKKEILKQRIEQENRKNMTFSPIINCSKGYRNKQNVYLRLYKQKQKEDRNEPYYQTYSHKPKITARGEKIERNMPVGELLYQDARRRAQKNNEIPQMESKNTQKNYTQQKYAAQKFLKDYKNALNATQLQEKTEYDNQELFLLMKQLGYARYLTTPNYSLFDQQKKLLQDCYSYLQQVGVTQINIYIFLLALSGIYGIDLNNDEIKGVLVIEEQEGKKINQYFDLLFRNRLFNDVAKKEKSPFKEQNSFRPSINPASQVMAERYRCKMLEKTNNIFSKNNLNFQISQKGLSHEEFLAICNLGQTLQRQKLRQIKMQEKDPECTFQPNHQKYQNSCSNIAVQKCRQLYQNAKAKHQQIQKITTFRSFQQKKPIKNEILSPKPNRNNNSVTKSKVKSYLQIRDVDKTLARMMVGRQQRNQKKQFQQRGEKITKKIQNTKKYTEPTLYQNELLLDADIMVNNTKRKIFIYKGEQNKVYEIVQKFSIECDLDQYSKNMLYERLVQAVNSLKRKGSQLLDSSF